MLPAPHRLRRRRDFDVATRRGRRTGSGTLVLHLARSGTESCPCPRQPVRVGFVVSRACGPAVVRNRVRRRLRHLVLERLIELPADAVLVVRTLPAAATASAQRLESDLTRCLARLLPPAGAPDGAPDGAPA